MNTEMYVPGPQMEAQRNVFWLVETHDPPTPEWPGTERDSPDHEGQRLRQQLNKDEPFKAEWIGASEEDCEAWAMDMQYRVNYIEQDHIVILDAQSARDGTVLVKEYVHALELDPDDEEPAFSIKEVNTWHNFRMEPQYVLAFNTDLTYGLATTAEPVYYGLKKELTDAHGIFDYKKAKRIVLGEEPGYDIQKLIASFRPKSQ